MMDSTWNRNCVILCRNVPRKVK